MKFLTASSLRLSLLILGLSQTPAIGFTLDMFSDGAQFITTTSNASDSVSSITGTDFGNRTIEVNMSYGRGSIEIDTGNNRASINANSLSDINFAEFTWGSDTATPQDFEDISGHDSLAIEILSIDLVDGADFQFTVTDSQATPQTAVSQKITIKSTGTIYFPYSDFETDNPNINLNSIEKVVLRVDNSPEAFDTTFDFIQSAEAVPFEFSSTLGIVIGGTFIGFNVLNKRSKKQ